MGRKKRKTAADTNQYAEEPQNAEEKKSRDAELAAEQQSENPPRTTSRGWFTTPKFGSSTSGGGEIEPGPERD